MPRRKREQPAAETRGRKIGDDKPPVDWRKEFGLELFDCHPTELLAMCEEIYQTRLRRLKWSLTPNAPLLLSRTNDAIMAARSFLDFHVDA